METLVRDTQYYVDKIETTNKSLLNEYKCNMITHATLRYPNKSKEEIESFVVSTITKKYVPLPVKILRSYSKGNIDTITAEKEPIDYLGYLASQSDNIRVPYGATYCKPNVEESFFSGIITERQASRKIVKKEMILAEAKGDVQTALLKHFRQLYIKTSINIFSGVMKANTNFKSALNYNAITSVSRFGIMTGYAFVERIIAGNFYFLNYNDVVNWTTNLLREIPLGNKLRFALSSFEIPVPTVQEVADHFASHIRKYDEQYDNTELVNYFSKMSPEELSFSYYGGNMKLLFFRSPKLKAFVTEIINFESMPKYTGEVKSIFALPDESIFIYSLVLISDTLIDSNGDNITHDRIDKEFPEIARTIYGIYHAVESKLKLISSLFEMFIQIDSMPHDVIAHKEMKREAVVLSDTDSILFTTAEWVHWMFDRSEVSKRAADTSAFIILMTCKSLIHVFRTIDMRMGMMPEHIDTLSMKNEFMYDVFLRVVHAKTYAGLNSYKEGAKLPKGKLDIKGKSFKGSDLCSDTTSDIKQFFVEVFDKVSNADEELTSEWLIRRVIGFEQQIKKSVMNGEVGYFKTTPIKSKSNYKNPLSSSYFYAMLWEAIFEEKYGNMGVPVKTAVINIIPSTVSSLEANKEIDPVFKKKLIDFLNRHNKKSVQAIYIPMGMSIPKEIIPLIDFRKCITANCFSFYLLLRSFEISVPSDGADARMLSEVYVSTALEMSE